MKISKLLTKGISTGQALQQIKKFYKHVSLESNPNPAFEHHKYLIKLDGKNVKTPNKNVLAPSTELLGLALTGEFLSQKEYMKPFTMPLFSLTRTAIDIDHDPNLRNHLEIALVNFFETDTIWYREEESPMLFKMQKENLDPIVEYINKKLNTKMKINLAFDSNRLKQSDLENLKKYFAQFNGWKILALEYAASTLKSTSLAIALMDDRLKIDEALDCSRLEEKYQQSLFGMAEGDHDFDEQTSRMMISSAKNFFNLTH